MNAVRTRGVRRWARMTLSAIVLISSFRRRPNPSNFNALADRWFPAERCETFRASFWRDICPRYLYVVRGVTNSAGRGRSNASCSACRCRAHDEHRDRPRPRAAGFGDANDHATKASGPKGPRSRPAACPSRTGWRRQQAGRETGFRCPSFRLWNPGCLMQGLMLVYRHRPGLLFHAFGLPARAVLRGPNKE